MRRLFRIAPFLLLIALWGCGQDGGGGNNAGAPQITSFTADPATIAASGTQVTLRWAISGTVTSLSIDNGIGPVAGNSRVVNPTQTTTYTLTASNSSGEATRTATVTVGSGTGGGSEPTGTFGGSTSQAGPFLNDSGGGISDGNDSRIVRAQPNSTIYFQAAYSDPDGITAVVPYLANDNVDTDLTPGTSVYGFTSAAPTGCTFGATQTSVTCTFAISVGNIPNITEIADFPDEFAYVFKVNVTDGAGTVTTNSTRAYVTVGASGTDPTTPDPTDPDPTTTDPTDPTTPDPTDPTTPDPTDPTTPDPTNPDPTNPDPTNPDPTEPEDDLEVSITGASPRSAVTNSPTALQTTVTNAGATATYAWTPVSGPNGGAVFANPSEKDTNVTFSAVGTYVLQIAVASGGESATDTVTFNVTAATDNEAPEVNIGGEVSQTATLNEPYPLTSVGTDPDGDMLTYQWSVAFGNANNVTFGSATSMNTTVTFSAAGSYSIRVTVTDPDGETDSDDVDVSVAGNL